MRPERGIEKLRSSLPDRPLQAVSQVAQHLVSNFSQRKKAAAFRAAALAREKCDLHAITLAKMSTRLADRAVATIAEVVLDRVVRGSAVVWHHIRLVRPRVAANAHRRIGGVGVPVNVTGAAAAAERAVA